MNYSRRQFVGMTTTAAVYFIAPRSSFADNSLTNPAFTVGLFKKIYDPSIGEKEQWYINDHTFIRAEDGQWHLFGITHKEPADPMHENFFAHVTAPDLMGPWTKQAPVLHADASKQETLVWAPYVLHHDGLYYMYYCAGNDDHAKYQIHLATSKDLFAWEVSAANPMVIDGYDARDPMVLRVGDQWVLYYCATSAPQGGNHTVKALTSPDLLHWSDAKEVFRSPATGTSGGPTESPFVVPRNGKYYLFICGETGYKSTPAYVSDSPFHWDPANKVGFAGAHAAEIVEAPGDKWYVSGAGWGNGGVDLAELTWKV
jgi:hypothetical protein